MKPSFNRLALAIVSTILLAGSMSCFTAMTLERDMPSTTSPTFQDTVFAIGQLDEASLKKINNPDALVFLGEQCSYLLEQGGRELVAISKELDGKRLEIKTSHPSLYLKEDKIFGSIAITYQRTEVITSRATEAADLARLGFKQASENPERYEKRITVKGLVNPKITMADSQMATFKVRRRIDFYNPPSSVIVPTIEKYGLLPVAVAADVVTSPLQLLGLTIICITLRNFH